MDLHYSQTYNMDRNTAGSFTTLWIYTILKQDSKHQRIRKSFTTLWIYTILKRAKNGAPMVIVFHYLMDLHYSQTRAVLVSNVAVFHYLMDLHYSQTYNPLFKNDLMFHYLMDLHYSQTLWWQT